MAALAPVAERLSPPQKEYGEDMGEDMSLEVLGFRVYKL